ncbi:MAG: TonB-dependent receptor [Opitutaceae bacterium]
MNTRSIRHMFVLGLLALSTSLSSRAGDIIGYVKDANTGRNLPGVNVKIPGTNRNTTTDREGRFRFGDLDAGNYAVQAEFMGYDQVSKTIAVPGIGTVNLDITVGEEVVELEAVEVEGYREGRSLALQQKRTAENIRDILSSDSVGQMPDRNVADALVRLPGVAVQMDNGEGRFVSIRGIAPDLNNVTVNGATVANPGVDGRAGRAMPLDVIGSAQISQLEVIKTNTPDMDAQGLGGTVEIKTVSAFDREKGWFTGSLEGAYNEQPDRYGYSGQVQWADRIGADKKWGIAIGASYEFRPFKNDSIMLRWDRDDFLTDYNNDGVFEGEAEDYPYAVDLSIDPEEGERTRVGLNTRIEFRPDENTEFYLNGIWNQFSEKVDKLEVVLGGDRLDYDEDQDYLTDGGSRDDRLEPFLTSPTTLWFPSTDAIDQRIGLEDREQTLINLTLGGRKRWNSFTLSGELTYSNAKENLKQEGQIQFRGRSGNDASMVMRDGDAVINDFNGTALPFFLDPEGDGLRYDEDNQRLAEIDGPTGGDPVPVLFDMSGELPNLTLPRQVAVDGSRWAHRRNRIDSSLVEENTYIPRVDLQWDTDSFLGTENSGFLKGGIKYFSRNRTIDDNSFRPNFCDESVDLQECLDRGDILFRRGNPIRPSAAAFPGLVVPGQEVLGQYNSVSQLSFEPAWDSSMGGFDPRNNNTLYPWAFDSVESSENNIEDDYDLDEKITALYLMFSTDLGEKFTLIGGVRYEKTDVDIAANTWIRFDDFGEDIEPPCANYDPNADSNFCLESSESNFDYTDFFPSIQGIYRFNNNLQLRAAFTTTTGRPNFEDAAPITRMETELAEARQYDDEGALVEVGEIEARARIRNPELQPYYSKNFDVSIEYFTDWGGAFSVAAFYKDIADPIFSFSTDDRYDTELDISNPDFANNFTVADAVAVVEDSCNCDVSSSFLPQDDAVARLRMEGWDNAEGGKVSGIELSAGMPLFFLPDFLDGLGVDANVSFIDSEIDILERQDDEEKTPFFQQPSTIANVALWYQRSGWQARIAWRYQDESFNEVSDPNDNFGDLYKAPRSQFDAQASYRFNENWTAYVNVKNLTNERDVRWFGNTSSRINKVEEFGRTWRLGVRWNY